MTVPPVAPVNFDSSPVEFWPISGWCPDDGAIRQIAPEWPYRRPGTAREILDNAWGVGWGYALEAALSLGVVLVKFPI